MTSIKNNILTSFLVNTFRVWRREFHNVFKNMGVVIFFLVLPTAYPIVYALIYNTELVKEVPVVVVDDARTDISREFTRSVGATQNIRIIGYAANLQEARRALNSRDCFGVLYLPSDFSEKIGRGEQSHYSFYSDMSLLLRYRGFLVALTSVSMEFGTELKLKNNSAATVSLLVNGDSPVPSYFIPMGNTEQGFASFIIPGIVILILQQSIVLGIAMLGASSRERKKANNGIDPQQINCGVLSNMIGKAMCYFTIYVMPTVYILHYVPLFFDMPQNGDIDQIFSFIMPYLFASIFFGMTLQVFVRERETSFLVIVFTSVIFLFLSGLTWPRFAMNDLWYTVGSFIPATWAMEGFVRMNTNGATLEQTMAPYSMLWVLCFAYFIISFLIIKYIDNKDYKLIAK